MRTVRKHFRATPTEVDGHRFDSKGEAARYGQLKLLQQAGMIQGLRVHPKLSMIVNGRKIGRGYITLDFKYERRGGQAWETVYEDYKAVDSRASATRREVCEAIHNIKIEVVEPLVPLFVHIPRRVRHSQISAASLSPVERRAGLDKLIEEASA